MRMIIAGGSGLIGRELTSSLLLRGHEVTILSRHPDKVIGMPPGVKVIQWDGKTIGDWVKEISKSEVVINLVGENLSGKGLFPSRWTKERKECLLRSRVDAGKALTRAIELYEPKPAVLFKLLGLEFMELNVSGFIQIHRNQVRIF